MLPNFDEDYIPIALIIMMVVIWVTGLSKGDDSIVIAGDIINFGIGAVAGYMTRNKNL